MSDEMRRKISMFCNVRPEAVLEELTSRTPSTSLPLMLRDEGVHRLIARLLGSSCAAGPLGLGAHRRHGQGRAAAGRDRRRGKYIGQRRLQVIYESISHAGIEAARVKPQIASDSAHRGRRRGGAAGLRRILVPGGFGGRGVGRCWPCAGYARTASLGLCYGLHMAVIGSRAVCG
jgi:CTP synthase